MGRHSVILGWLMVYDLLFTLFPPDFSEKTMVWQAEGQG
jgi:hypothetical protein